MAAGDYAVRVETVLHRRGRRAGPGVQPDGRRPRHRRPPAPRPGGERLPRAAHAADRARRRAGEPRRRRDRGRPGHHPGRARPGRAAEHPRRRPARPVPGRRGRGGAGPHRRRRSPSWSRRPSPRRGPAMREVSFDVRVEPADLRVDADRSRLHQLLANLLDNAARHSPAGGSGARLGGRVGGVVRLEVSDEGAGIAPEDRERVFVRFGTLPGPAGRWHRARPRHRPLGDRPARGADRPGRPGRGRVRCPVPGRAPPAGPDPPHPVVREEPTHDAPHPTPPRPAPPTPPRPATAAGSRRRGGPLRLAVARPRRPGPARRPAGLRRHRGLRGAHAALHAPRARDDAGAAGLRACWCSR